jgi:hypothetical protein
VTQLAGLRDTFHPDGVRTGGSVDESAILDARTAARLTDGATWSHEAERFIAPGATWVDLNDWSDAESAARQAGPGSTVYVLMSRLSGEGHAFALRYTEDARLFWIDLQRPVGERLIDAGHRPASPAQWVLSGGDRLESAFATRVLVVDDSGTARPELVASQPESASPARAVIDAPIDRGYGKGGFEKEKPRYRINALPEGFHYSRKLVTGLVDIAMDRSPEGNVIVESVSNPGWMVPGDQGAPPIGQLLDRQTEIDHLLRNSRPYSKIKDIFWDRSKYTITPGAEDVEVFVDPTVPDDWDAVQFTAGIDADYDWLFLDQLRGQAWQEPINGYLVEGLDFGRDWARRFTASPHSGHDGRPLGLLIEALHSDPNVNWVRTIATSAYLHNAALLRNEILRRSGTPSTVGPKNQSAAVSRVSPTALINAAPQPVQSFLAANRDKIHASFLRTFVANEPRSHEFELTDIASWRLMTIAKIQGQRWTVYFDNFVIPKPDVVIDQYKAMGIRTRFAELDTNRGRRVGPGFDLWELRYLDSARVDTSTFEDRFHWLGNTTQTVHGQAERSRQINHATVWTAALAVSDFSAPNPAREQMISELDRVWSRELATDPPPRVGLLDNEAGQPIQKVIDGLDRAAPASWNALVADLTRFEEQLVRFDREHVANSPIESSRNLQRRRIDQAVADLRQLVGRLESDAPPWLRTPPIVEGDAISEVTRIQLAGFADQVVQVARHQNKPVVVHLEAGVPRGSLFARKSGLKRADKIAAELMSSIQAGLTKAGLSISTVELVTDSRGSGNSNAKGFRVETDSDRRSVIGWLTVSGAAPTPLPSRSILPHMPATADMGDDLGLSTIIADLGFGDSVADERGSAGDG